MSRVRKALVAVLTAVLLFCVAPAAAADQTAASPAGVVVVQDDLGYRVTCSKAQKKKSVWIRIWCAMAFR